MGRIIVSRACRFGILPFSFVPPCFSPVFLRFLHSPFFPFASIRYVPVLRKKPAKQFRMVFALVGDIGLTFCVGKGGISHGFVVHFENEVDRGYYVTKDPAHLAFVKSLEGIVEKAVVVDYVPGVF